MDDELGNLSMLELFKAEAENQTGVLTAGLLELDAGSGTPECYEALMRAAHSLKGAARIVNVRPAVRVAHALEDCFVAAQDGLLKLQQPEIDLLLCGVDLLSQLARCSERELARWETAQGAEVDAFLSSVKSLRSVAQKPDPGGETSPTSSSSSPSHTEKGSAGPVQTLHGDSSPVLQPDLEPSQQSLTIRRLEPPERVLRLTAENLNRLLGLAGESLVESRWLRPFADNLQRLKRHHSELDRHLESLRQALGKMPASERVQECLDSMVQTLTASRQHLADRIQDLDMFDRRSSHLSQRLYLEVLRTRMRPFSDGVRRFPRMVRDLARSLNKEVRLEISGENTQVDRDILERLETPLAHLLRNAVDHGCECPESRREAGKREDCTIRLEARHSAGMLVVTVSDEGPGVNLERVRRAIIKREMLPTAAAEKLTETELLDFLVVPGFTLKDTVTEISGRGFGLDVVQNMVKSVRGTIRLTNQAGHGLRVQLQLPLTLSVLRALLVEVAGEPYAIPLGQISRTLQLNRTRLEELEGRPHFRLGEQNLALLTAHQVLDCGQAQCPGNDLPVVVLGDRTRYGVVVDRFLGQRELVVQPLDHRLGKVRDISAAALMEDGAPVLILDVEDMVRSIEKLLADGSSSRLHPPGLRPLTAGRPRRVLAVDDSLTMRELERKLLVGRGYVVDVAVDGREAWEVLHGAKFDLVITDIDMPHMDGIELAARIKKDTRLKSVPVLIVSHKDREEDRLRGLEAGADYYLTKSSFHEEKLLQAVLDLIGEPEG